MSKKYLYFIAAGHLSVDLAGSALPAILPFLVEFRGMNYTEVAGLVFAFAFISSLLQPVFGYLADKVSNHAFMGLGIIFSGVSFASTGFTESYWTAFFAVSISGIGSAMFHPEAARFVNLISADHKGEGLSIFSVGGNAGFGIGPMLAVAVLSLFGLHGLAVFGVTGLSMGLATIILVPRIAKSIKSKTSTAKKVSQVAGAKNNWSAFRKLTVVLMGRSIVLQGIMAFLPLYAIYHLSIPHESGSLLLSIYSIVGILMTILGGKLADNFNLVSVLKICSLFYLPTVLLMTFAPSYIFLAVLTLPLAFATHASYSPFVVLGQIYLAKNLGFASGVTLGLSTGFGGMVAPLLGMFADNFGLETSLYLLAAVGLATTIGALVLPKPESIKN